MSTYLNTQLYSKAVILSYIVVTVLNSLKYHMCHTLPQKKHVPMLRHCKEGQNKKRQSTE